MQGEKNAKSQQLQQASEMLDAKVKEKELSAPMAHKVEVLTRVRNWFHSSNGPRTMSLNALGKMTKYVNEYLKEMHSEITVTPDNQGLSFAYEYVDGRPISDPPPSTAKLSGGQKIELALAFRLAIYRYFGQKMGIMVRDEPTAHLSPAGIEYFGQLLQTVSTLARNMNLQIIMPTHEKEIMQFMDSEIHFD
jgi:DNA repair exonuclease SbcCD ATPase subunit